MGVRYKMTFDSYLCIKFLALYCRSAVECVNSDFAGADNRFFVV